MKSLIHPIGVMVANDRLGWRVAEPCRQAGIRIPEDIARLGVDNDETICHLIQPPLSSIQVDAKRIGYLAAAMLHQLMMGGTTNTRQRISPRSVVVRPSLDLFAIDDELVLKALAIIAEHATRSLDVTGIVKRLVVSRRTLERRFQVVLQRSVLDEIRRVRINAAKDLLTTTDLDMRQIAARCGFTGAT